MKSRHDFAKLITAIVLGLIVALSSPGASAAPTFTVNSVVDTAASAPLDNGICETSPGNGTCTLRAAIMKANHFPGGGVTIVIPANTYGLTIAPTGADDELTGDLNITASMTINGAAAATTIIDANKIDRVLTIQSGTVMISNLTMRNGSASGAGGGINSAGSLTLNSAVVSSNRSGNGSAGGGIVSQTTLILNNTVVSDNQAGGNAGGIYNNGTATVNNSFISGNLTLSGGYGGGILNNATMTITGSLISGNRTLQGSGLATSGKGGGFWNAGGTLTIVNSTISNNSALSDGGGIYNQATVFTHFTTIAGNLAANDGANSGTGGGIKNGSGAVNLRTTLLGQNYAGTTLSDLSGTIASQDYNLIQTTAGATITGVTTHNFTGFDPLLDSLHDNGGITQTRALFTGSFAIDEVPAAQCTDQFGSPMTIDQRGAQRGNGSCDIGAYEGSISNSLYGRNLVPNGDAEAAAGSPPGATVGIPYWSTPGSQFTAVPYNSAGGFPNVATDTVPANHGYGFFAGGNSSYSDAQQTISVSNISSQIDTGKVAITFSADLGGYFSDGDNADVVLYFRDSTGRTIDPAVFLGPVSPADRGNKTGLLHRSSSRTIPPGTRSLGVIVNMTRSNGVANDAYADNISLVLTPPPTLAQISTRMAVQTGDNVLFGGFIVTGTQPKKVIIRAIGPSLTNFGVQGALANPTLQLFNGSQQLIDSNDNWVDSPSKQAILNSGVAPTNNLEAAIIQTLPANSSNYTAILRGASNGTGIGVVEVYDLDYAADARLANISARGSVQTGDNVMFGGFIVVGSGPQKVIVRAIGPSLSNFGVQGALSDPTLELHDGNGGLLEANDNWTDSPNKQAIIDSGIPPSDSRESAIVRIIDPAPFTAIVRGSGGATGIAVVEVYSL